MQPDAPTLLGRYRLGPTMGSGGMAEVRRAEDLALGRPVAVKLLHPHLATDPAFMERFEREARLAAGLSHPGVVAVFDRGVADGRPFLVMELVEGESLAALLRREGPLAPERTLAIADDLLAALEHAHSRGVVHRDVKPHNVLLAPDGRAKLADFGIAYAAAAAAFTAPGEVLGSLRYVAPERLAGEPGSPATDLYGLGAVLYEALTGRAPFEGDHPASIAAQHAAGTPRPPSALRPELPTWLDAALLRALAKAPADRFPAASAMRAALASRGAPVDAPAVPFAPAGAATVPFAPAGASTVPFAPVAGSTVPLPAGAGATARWQRAPDRPGAAVSAGPTIRRPGGAPLVVAAAAILVVGAVVAFASLSRTSAGGPAPGTPAASAQGRAATPPPAAPTPTRTAPAPAAPAPTAPAKAPPPTPAPPSPTPPRPPTATARPPAAPAVPPTATARAAAASLADQLARLRALLDEAAPAKPKPSRGKDRDDDERDGGDTIRALIERLDEAQRHLAAGRLDAARDQLRELAARVATDAARGRIDPQLAGRILAELQGLTTR